jgi:hypothetical protein
MVVPIAIDVAPAAGIAEIERTYGATVTDVNGDGAPDFLLGRHFWKTGQLFLNDQAGHFNEINNGMLTTKDRHGCGSADWNLDGLMDIACAVGSAHGTGFKANELWTQGSGQTFTNTGITSGIADPYGRSRRITFLDANADGYPDIFLGNEGERPGGLPTYNRLFLNNQGRSFVPAPEFGLDGKIGREPVARDYNGDGFTDVLLSGTDSNISLFRNNAGHGFTDVSNAVGIGNDIGAFGTLADFNGDGTLDLVEVFATTLQIRLQIGGVFQVGYTRPILGGRWIATGDVNGDSRPDIYVARDNIDGTTGADLMLLNDGTGSNFVQMDIPQASSGRSDGVYAMDYDGNGLTDFLVVNGGGSARGPLQLIAFFLEPPQGSFAPLLEPRAAAATSTDTAEGAGSSSRASCGPSWQSVALPVRGLNPHGMAVAGPNDIWAVGHQHGGGHVQVSSGHWDGTAWSLVPMPEPGVGDNGLNAVAVASPNDVWAVGFSATGDGVHGEGSNYGPIAYEWDGTDWVQATLPDVSSPSSSLTGVAVNSVNDIWAVGYRKIGVAFQTLAMHRDAVGWSIVPTPNIGQGNNSLTGVTVLSANDVWAVGWRYDGTAPKTLTEHWNGTSWAVVPSPNTGIGANVLTGVGAVSPSDIWAVGYRQDTSYHTLTQHWNGTAWSMVASADSGSVFSGLRSVIPVSSRNVWVGGAAYDALAGTYQTMTENWDGASWTIVPTARTSGPSQIEAMAVVSDNDLWAIGSASESNANLHNCPVRVLDAGFVPAGSDVVHGAGVSWSIPSSDSQAHRVVDMTGMGLFDSGVRQPGSTFTYTYIGAGWYLVQDSATGSTSQIRVPLNASPLSGTTTTVFTITWSSVAPPAGYVFDIQIKRPQTSTWLSWLDSQTGASATFTPDVGPGVYRFRARMRKVSNDEHSGWSSAVLITVT